MYAPSRERPSAAAPAARRPDSVLWAVLALTALAAAVRFSTLSVQSYWLDESVTVDLLRMPFGDMLSAVPNSESTPPLYYVVAWVWSQLFGTGEAALRSLSALFGTLTIPFAYAAVTRLVSRRAGLVAAALAAVNPLLVWYSQEARAYSLLVLLTAVALLFFARALERPTRGALAGWALASIAALATHYFALFVVVPEAAWLLWRRRRAPELIAIGAVAAAGAALLPLAIDQAGNHAADFIGKIGLAKRLVQVPKQYLVGFDAPLETAVSVAAIALAAFGLWLLAARASTAERRGAARAAAIAVPAIGVPLVLALVRVDYFITRNLIAAWLPCAGVLAAGFGATRARVTGALAAGALCALSLFVVIGVDANPTYQRGDWRGAAHALAPLRTQRAMVVSPVAGGRPLALYMPRLYPYPNFATPVSEIDVLAIAERRRGQTPAPPRPATPPPAPPGFAFAGEERRQTFTLIRYRAPQPTPVAPPVLGQMRLEPGLADLIVQVEPGFVPKPPFAAPAGAAGG